MICINNVHLVHRARQTEIFILLFGKVKMLSSSQASLAINPAALLPGAAPPVKEEKPVAVGFDQPVEATTLHTAQKVRTNFHVD